MEVDLGNSDSDFAVLQKGLRNKMIRLVQTKKDKERGISFSNLK